MSRSGTSTAMELAKMRYEKGRKEATHQRIIEVASKEFRKSGIAAAGLAGIMETADLTIGAFYPNFKSKAELVTETVTYMLDLKLLEMRDMIASGGLEAGIRSYLNLDHLMHPDQGCPSAALLPEIPRQADETRIAYKHGLQPFISLLAENMPEGNSKAGNSRALALFSLMVGTLQIARAMPDATLAERIVKSGLEAAFDMVGLGGHSPLAAKSTKPKSPKSRTSPKKASRVPKRSSSLR